MIIYLQLGFWVVWSCSLFCLDFVVGLLGGYVCIDVFVVLLVIGFVVDVCFCF